MHVDPKQSTDTTDLCVQMLKSMHLEEENTQSPRLEGPEHWEAIGHFATPEQYQENAPILEASSNRSLAITNIIYHAVKHDNTPLAVYLYTTGASNAVAVLNECLQQSKPNIARACIECRPQTFVPIKMLNPVIGEAIDRQDSKFLYALLA